MTYFFNPARPDDPTDLNSPTAPDLVAIAPPELSPGEPITGYIPCEYDPTEQRITFPDGTALPWPPAPPPPPPVADWVGFFQSVREQWNALTALTTANTATLVILIARMPVTDPTSLQILATEWNECVNGLPADHGIDFAAVAARAIAYHCDLFANINPITGRFPI